MDREKLKALLEGLQKGNMTIDEAMDRLDTFPYEDLGFACIDHHRNLRRGVPEIVYGEGKDLDELISIVKSMIDEGDDILVTRVSSPVASELILRFPSFTYHRKARALTLVHGKREIKGRGTILVMSAGTSDIPVAEEAAVTARFLGNEVDTIYDVGVAGLHRILSQMARIKDASVIVVAAGMEGALPSVVAGLVRVPVIAVPTSVGYGASFKGIGALLAMLNSCSAGVTVVNIDNGFGAGYAASLINT